MKRLIAILLCLSQPSWGAIALVNTVLSIGKDSHTSSSIDTTGSTLLIMSVSEGTSAGNAVPSDNKGNTWVGLTEINNSNTQFQRIYYVTNPTVGTGHTFTLTGTNTFSVSVSAGFSGTDTSSPFDVENGAANVWVAHAYPGSITPTADNELVVTGMVWDRTSAMTVTGYTMLGQHDRIDADEWGGGAAYNIQTTATATNPEWNVGQPLFGAVVAASFKAGGAAPTAVVCPSPFCGIIQ